jgi:hypothetical protein
MFEELLYGDIVDDSKNNENETISPRNKILRRYVDINIVFYSYNKILEIDTSKDRKDREYAVQFARKYIKCLFAIRDTLKDILLNDLMYTEKEIKQACSKKSKIKIPENITIKDLNQNLADIENTLQNTINIFNRRYSKL